VREISTLVSEIEISIEIFIYELLKEEMNLGFPEISKINIVFIVLRIDFYVKN